MTRDKIIQIVINDRGMMLGLSVLGRIYRCDLVGDNQMKWVLLVKSPEEVD